MIAAHYDRPNIIAVILLHTFSKLDDHRIERGVCARDRDGLTAAQIAVKQCSVASLSVLLYLYPKFAERTVDFSSHSSLLDVATLPSFKSDETVAFFSDHYPHIADQIFHQRTMLLKPTRSEIVNESSEGFVTGVNDDAALSKLTLYLANRYKSLRTFPKAVVFISIETAIFISVYILASIMRLDRTEMFIYPLYFSGILSLVFIRSLYSKLCIESPGSFRVQPRQHPSTADKLYGPDSEACLVGSEKSYRNGLNMIYAVSNIARKSRSEQLEQVENKEDLLSTNFCCHYCRIYRPLRSIHSKQLRRCIPHFDHYCVFLGNHVGRDNYPYYISSLLAAVGVVMPLFITNLYYYVYHLKIVEMPPDAGAIPIVSFFSFISSVSKPHALIENTPLHLYKTISNLLLLLDFNIQSPLKYFLVWSCLWWFVFLSLLSLHLYLICMDVTTRECIDSYDTRWLKKRAKAPVKPNNFRVSNICIRMFPREDDVCYTSKDLQRLLERPHSSFSEYKSRLLVAFSETLSGQRTSNAVSIPIRDFASNGEEKCK